MYCFFQTLLLFVLANLWVWTKQITCECSKCHPHEENDEIHDFSVSDSIDSKEARDWRRAVYHTFYPHLGWLGGRLATLVKKWHREAWIPSLLVIFFTVLLYYSITWYFRYLIGGSRDTVTILKDVLKAVVAKLCVTYAQKIITIFEKPSVEYMKFVKWLVTTLTETIGSLPNNHDVWLKFHQLRCTDKFKVRWLHAF